MNEGLGPRERIRKKSDFLFLYKNGCRYRGRYFNLVYFPNSLAFSRMAIVVSKKVGKAVTRNKVKRWIRDLFRRNKDWIRGSFDIMIIAKKEILEISRLQLRDHYLRALESLNRRIKPK
jgi:ribonuclease P protein component